LAQDILSILHIFLTMCPRVMEAIMQTDVWIQFIIDLNVKTGAKCVV
jgi:hypothetical protein